MTSNAAPAGRAVRSSGGITDLLNRNGRVRSLRESTTVPGPFPGRSPRIRPRLRCLSPLAPFSKRSNHEDQVDRQQRDERHGREVCEEHQDEVSAVVRCWRLGDSGHDLKHSLFQIQRDKRSDDRGEGKERADERPGPRQLSATSVT